MSHLVLASINARYIHSSLGLRSLRANLGPWRERSEILEFTLDHRPADVVEAILSRKPTVVGLGVYIWNVHLMDQVVSTLKSVRPDLPLILGGPELIDPQDWPSFAGLADHVVVGDGEGVLPQILEGLSGNPSPQPLRTWSRQPPPPDRELRIAPPDAEYSDEDIAHRLIYVEASRGCPYGCEFCLSSRERRVERFSGEDVLAGLSRLWDRGARQFKFVDRALHLGGISPAILHFFLDRLDASTFVHMEVVPEAIPDWAWSLLAQFPEGQLQLELGIQSLNGEVSRRIGRRQNPERTLEVVRRLRQETSAHLHTDLVLGLPGETLESIADSFDRLLDANPHEIQVGILKRLRGAPIVRHDVEFSMKYAQTTPYEVLSTSTLDFLVLQRLKRFARYFDLTFNSGNFPETVHWLLAPPSPFFTFLAFSDWLFETLHQTGGIAMDRLCERIAEFLTAHRGVPAATVLAALERDYRLHNRSLPLSLKGDRSDGARERSRGPGGIPKRQKRHGLRDAD